MKRRRRSSCPVHFALRVFGDAWTLLVVRDLMFKGRTSYSEFLRADEGIATNILADRLTRLEADGIIVKKEAGDYRLTERGCDLLPLMLEIIAWSARHDPKTAADPTFVRRLQTDRGQLTRQLKRRLKAHWQEEA